MSLTSSLFTGVSGLTNQGNAMQVIGDNISNVNTLGFKGNRFTFSDLLSQSIATQSGTAQVGRGVGLGSVDASFQQGSLESTGNTTDLSIGGDGFFVVRKASADQDFYTRAGNFNLDKDGQLVNDIGYVVQGWQLDADTSDDIGAVGDIVLQGFTSPPKASTQTTVITNLDSDSESHSQVLANAWDGLATDPDPFIAASAYEYQTVVKAYDSLGSTHDITVYYDKKSGSEWEYIVTMNPSEDKRNLVQNTSGLGLLARGAIQFSESSGTISGMTMDTFSGRIGNVVTDGAITPETTVFTIDNFDAVPNDGANFNLEFDGAGWEFAELDGVAGITANDKPQAYRNARIVSGDANGIRLNLDNDAEGTVDLEISFSTPAQATDSLKFDIIDPDNVHVQDITDTRFVGESGNDNTQLSIDNPSVLTVDATGLNIIWDASETEWYWSNPTLQNVVDTNTTGLNVAAAAVPPINVAPLTAVEPAVMKFFSDDVELFWNERGAAWEWRSPNALGLTNEVFAGGVTQSNSTLTVNDITLLNEHSTGNSLFWDDIIGVTGLASVSTAVPPNTAADITVTMPQEENLTVDSTPVGGYQLQYDGANWNYNVGRDPVVDYGSRVSPVGWNALTRTLSTDLTGDGADIQMVLANAPAVGDTIAFAIDADGQWSWSMPTLNVQTFGGGAAPDTAIVGSNTEINILNPAAVTLDSTVDYELEWDVATDTWGWAAGGGNSPGTDPGLAVPYAAEAITGDRNGASIDLTGDGVADIEFTFAVPLADAASGIGGTGRVNFRLDRFGNPPAEYSGATIMAGSGDTLLAIDLQNDGTADLTYDFTAPLQANGSIAFDIDTHIPPSEYANAQIVAGSGAGSIQLDLDSSGTTNLTFTFQDSTVAAPVARSMVANSTFTFDIDPRVPPTEYANAQISGDEDEVLLDMDNDTVDDVRFTFSTPLSTGAGATDSEILFNIEGTTAWTEESTNDNGYFEFDADFLGGTAGSTGMEVELNIGTKDDGTGQFVNDSLSSTQFARSNSTVFQTTDGFGAGDLEGLDVDSDGVITGIYSNGELIPLFRVALAKFVSNAGLSKEGNNLFRETRDSGAATTNRPGSNGLGTISPNTLEMSNVDIASEFVKMISTQRGFQANSKVITTVDSMLGDVIQLKR